MTRMNPFPGSPPIQAEAVCRVTFRRTSRPPRGSSARPRRPAPRSCVLPELFPLGVPPARLAAQPTTDVVADADRAIVDPRLDPRVAAREHRAIVVVVAPDGVRRSPNLLVARRRSVRCGHRRLRQAAALGVGRAGVSVAGEHGATVTIDEWRFGLGVLTTAPSRHGRAVALAGADGPLVPSGTCSARSTDAMSTTRRARWTTRCTSCSRTRSAVRHRGRSTGETAIYEPEGRAVVRAPDVGEHVVVADLDPAPTRPYVPPTRCYRPAYGILGGRVEIAVA